MTSPPAGPRRPWLALALTVPLPTLGTCAAFWWWPGATGTALYFLSKAWVMALPLWWTRLVDGERWSWSPPRRGGFALGAGLGLAMSALLVGLYLTVGPWLLDTARLRDVAAASGLDRAAVYLGGAVFWITVNSVLEEYLFRWFMFRQLAARASRGVAVLAVALAFTVHHTFALQLQFDWRMATLGSVGLFVGGATWSWLYARTGSIWPGYASHAIADAAVFGLGAVLIFGG